MAVITVSREYGSCGEEIAKQVAKALDYSYFDKEILTDVARAAGTTEERVSRYDEKGERGFRVFLRKIFVPEFASVADFPYYDVPGVPLQWLSDTSEEEGALQQQLAPDANEVAAFFRQVIEKLWQLGNVVIVGRGGQKILAGKSKTLHVRFVGLVKDRSKTVMTEEGIAFPDALKQIERIDKQRLNYFKHYFEADWADPTLYHMVLNTSFMSIAQAVQTIIAAVRHQEEE
ncbi:MAG: cytidylate kinase-like family protein [Candidatus Poribacteria bacterium]|nr:cytidylate kinase-like family protein [Candidatus Poribacteria bacterium]